MKTRKIYGRVGLGVALACVSLSASADLTLELTPGSASSHAREITEATGTLKVTGEVDVRDFATLNSLPESVTCLDMSEMKVAARGTAIPDAMGIRLHPADHIPPYAFFRCPTREVVFPSACSLGEGVMANAATESVTLPEELLEIPAYAFYRSAVKEIIWSESVLRVGAYAFFGSFAEYLSFPSLRLGGDYALASMPALKEVTLSPSAQLGVGFLMGCGSLEKVYGAPETMPDYFAADTRSLDAERLVVGTREIGDYAVANARNEAIVLASGLKSIGEGTFAGMTRLVMIEANPCGSVVPEISESAFYGIVPENVSLYVAQGTASSWRADAVWGRFNIVEGLSSVSTTGVDESGILFSYDGFAVDITSPEPLTSVEVYDSAGRILMQSNPGLCSVRLSIGDIPASGVVMVRASGARGASSVKFAL